MPITPIPDAPVVPQYPALGSLTFNQQAYAYGTAMPGVTLRLHEIAVAARANAVDAASSAGAAAGSAIAAAESATQATTNGAAQVALATVQANLAMGYRDTAGAHATTATNKAAQTADDAAATLGYRNAAQAAAGNAATEADRARDEADRAEAAAASIADGPVTSVGGATGVVMLKTLNGQALIGVGNIVLSTDAVRMPVNVSPAQAATSVTEAPALTGSAFLSLYGLSMAASQWQVSTAADFSSTVVSTGDVAGPSTSYTLAAGILSVSTVYYWRVRYKDAEGVYSTWSAPTSFTTAATFSSYIATPAPTPANFGDPFEGGFYAGMIWGQIAQSSTSMALTTGSKVFTVPDMTAVPIVYDGQTIEVRSRANPANKMVGTVTGAAGTNLTINVTSIGGSGTFSDWSIMARYRVIVAPKASGEHAGIALKNAQTALPTACQTLTEGLRATQAMRDADSSTVYPAAHWARGLSIGGRTDWYIPARDELELCWRNLKPTTTANHVTANRPAAASFNNGSYGDTAATHGTNNNSSPTGAAYTASVPGQTAATAFRTGGAEAYEFGSAYYWSSSDYDASSAWGQSWHSSVPGNQYNFGKSSTYRVRAVRRSIV